jgi:uncharacterized protein YbjT (DUF2867 family)
MAGTKTVLLTGATGYIGRSLLRRLEELDRPVRCLVRRQSRPPSATEATEVVRGDLLQPQTLGAALHGVGTAYYLVHSMAAKGSFRDEDCRAARNFAVAARAAGVEKIVYLGGLGNEGDLSAHLSSRQEVGRILRESGVPTIEFRASIILGQGSLSFEMIRALVEKLPIMVTPRWVSTRAQPISEKDVLDYLMAALDKNVSASAVYEIGGADQVSYGDILREYARQRGLTRFMVSVPMLTPWLSSLWLGLVTPLHARVGRKLIDGVRSETIVTDERAREEFDVFPSGLRTSVARALAIPADAA